MLDSNFKDAAERIKSASSLSNQQLLKLYALYKQATKGDVSGKRPGAFSLAGRAKYDAWAEIKGTGADQAKEQYIALVDELLSS
ncbi:MAG: acyl-CoA-binding protein [Saprospiraceae bacterium]